MYLTKMLSRAELQREPVPDKDIVLIPTGIFPWCDVAMTMKRQDWDEVYVECRAVEPDIEPVFAAILSGTNSDLIRAFGTLESVQTRYTVLREQLAEQESPTLAETKPEETGNSDSTLPDGLSEDVPKDREDEAMSAASTDGDGVATKVFPADEAFAGSMGLDTPSMPEPTSSGIGLYLDDDDDLDMEFGRVDTPSEEKLANALPPTVERNEKEVGCSMPKPEETTSEVAAESWVDLIQQARAEEEQSPTVDVAAEVPGLSEIFNGGLLGEDLGADLQVPDAPTVTDERSEEPKGVQSPAEGDIDFGVGVGAGISTPSTAGEDATDAPPMEFMGEMLFPPEEFMDTHGEDEQLSPEQMMDAALEMANVPSAATPKIEEYNIPNIDEMAGPAGPSFEEIAAKAATTVPPIEFEEPELPPQQKEEAKAFQEIMDTPASQPIVEHGPSDSLKMEIVGIRKNAMESGEVQYTARESDYIAPCVKLFASMYSDYRVTFMNVSLDKIIASNGITPGELAERIGQAVGKPINPDMMEASEKFLQVYVEAYCVALEKMESGDEKSALAIAKAFAGLIYEE